MRKKQFDPDVALDKAMQVFWAQGYESTSMRDLIVAMNIQRQSLYDTFANKRALYLQVLRFYHQHVVVPNFAPLFEHESPLQAIHDYFNARIEQLDDPNIIEGCLVTNSVAELGGKDDEINHQLTDTLQHMKNAFYTAVSRAQELGEISSQQDARVLSLLLLNHAQGLFVLSKSGLSHDELQTVVKQALAILE